MFLYDTMIHYVTHLGHQYSIVEPLSDYTNGDSAVPDNTTTMYIQ